MEEKIGDSKSKEVIEEKTDQTHEEEPCLIESDDLDSVHSGESLLKTFTFKPNEDSPEMKKCISFWQKILEKELKPVKCILVPTKKPKKEKSEEDAKLLQINSDKEKWMKALEEIKRRKLDDLKLVKLREKPVDCCQLLESDMTEKITINKKEQKREIIELNTWQASSSPSKLKTIENLSKKQAPPNKKIIPEKQEEKQTPVEKIPETTPAPTPEKNIEDIILEELKEIPEIKTATEEPKPNIPENKEPDAKTVEVRDDNDTSMKQTEKTEDKTCQCGCQFANCLCSDFDYTLNLEGCMCGCQTNNCECEKFNNLKICECSCELFSCICQEKEFQSCTECSCCLIDCKCHENDDEKQTIIDETGKVIKSERENIDDGYCKCNCGLLDCICLKLYERKETSCDCGFECLCKSCESCLEVEETEFGSKDGAAMSNENIWRLIDVTRAGNVYCPICGRFDCYCSK